MTITNTTSLWSKNLDFYCLNAWISEKNKVEEANYLQVLLEILKFYQEIDENLLFNIFGLDKKIGIKLLSKLAIEYPGQVIKTEKGIRFQLGNANGTDKIKEANPTLTQKPMIFAICVNPPICLTKRIAYTEVNDTDVQSQSIIPALEEIKMAMKSQARKKDYFVPDQIEDLHLERGVQVLGKAKLFVQWNENKFEVLDEKRKVIEISKNHPIFELLMEELNSLITNEDLIESKVKQWTDTCFSGINSSIKLNHSTGELELQVLETNLDLLGRIFHLYLQYNSREQNIDIDLGWKLKVRIKFSFTNLNINQWIKFFSLLNDKMDKSYAEILPKLGLKLEKIKEIWQTLPFSTQVKFNVSNFISNLKFVIIYNPELWFSHILARLLEGEIFV